MPHILVVDDTPDFLAAAAKALRFLQNRVDTADCGAAALVRLATPTGSYDLVFLDLMMPETDGFGVLRAARADLRTAGLPIVVLSAMTDKPARRAAAAAGATAFLAKGSVGLDELEAVVARYAAAAPLV